MAIEVYPALQGLNAVLGGLKAIMDIRDEYRRNMAFVDLTRQLAKAIEECVALQLRVSAQEAEIAQMKAFDAEAERYEMKSIGAGAVSYMLKPDARGTEPPHWLCPNCFAQKTKAFLQPDGRELGGIRMHRCVRCAGVVAAEGRPAW